ncbi:MAG: radical SAM protein [Clostridiales bacterium]|jgi:uncharacterized radical SAM superfamily Fe-S cluster-containing enzyme|nr:radical SAM protein [Clostridiales bacterium]
MNEASRSKIHLINELPHIYEIEDMLAFCRNHKHVYIYGTSENQELLLKFLDICKATIEGYAVSPEFTGNATLEYRKLPILNIDDAVLKEGAGIIVGLSDRHYMRVIPKFRKLGFKEYFILTEYTKRTIACQMKPRSHNEMGFEVSLVDHCNMSCQMCDHYSQLSNERFIDLDSFENDMKHLSAALEHEIGCITLIGGEPTLHKDIIKFMEITRREFPAGQIIILTNGLLLLSLENSPQGNLWSACNKLNVDIYVTVYPISFDYGALEKKALQYGVELKMSSDIHSNSLTMENKISDKHTFNLSKGAGKHQFISCLYFNKFNVVKDGRYYMCPISAHIDIFNEYFKQSLEITSDDSLDIKSVKDWRTIVEFTSRSIPFCEYCDLKNWHRHSIWKASTKEISEYA